MPKPPQPIGLSNEDQHYLETYVSQGKRSARSIKRAHVLLRRHAGQSPQDTAAAVGVSIGTVFDICRRYRAEGVGAALAEKPRSGQPPKLSLRQGTELTVLACSKAPNSRPNMPVGSTWSKLDSQPLPASAPTNGFRLRRPLWAKRKLGKNNETGLAFGLP